MFCLYYISHIIKFIHLTDGHVCIAHVHSTVLEIMHCLNLYIRYRWLA